MKRKILFRGKRTDNKEWIYGDVQHGGILSQYERTMFIKPRDKLMTEIISETLGEFTGLRDKNKKGIYEDDIVKIDFCGDYDYYKVSFDEKNARFVIGTLDFTFWQDVQERAEVVGNVFDNPELLKGDAKE